MISNRLIYL